MVLLIPFPYSYQSPFPSPLFFALKNLFFPANGCEKEVSYLELVNLNFPSSAPFRPFLPVIGFVCFPPR